MSALQEHLDEIMIALRPHDKFSPIPRASDRAAWQGVRQKTGEAIIARAAAYMDMTWPVITATDVMLAAINGDMRSFAPKYQQRRDALAALALGEAVEGKGRFLTDIINLCFMICEETAWTLPVNMVRADGARQSMPDIEWPVLDMGAARTAALLAVVLYLHREKFREASSLIAVRIEREITMRVIDPFIKDPRVRFMQEPGETDPMPEGVKECLTALLLIEREDKYRWSGVKKALMMLDEYLDELPSDGGIPGGMGAFESGAGCLMEALELISEASGGNTSFFTISTLRRICDFVAGSHIDLDQFNCAGNCPAHLALDSNLLYRCGVLIRSDDLRSLGAYLMRLGEVGARSSLPLLRAVRAALDESEMLRHDSRPPMPMDYYLGSGELLCVRSRTGSADGFFATLEGGINRPGGHADAGNFTLFWNGAPVLPDLGEIEYAKDMSIAEREALWETQSQYHNLPVINNCPQGMGDQFMAVEPMWELKPERSRATLDISRAYPPEAGVVSWQRTLALVRGEKPRVNLWEYAEFAGNGNEIEFNFITTHYPVVMKEGVELGGIRMSWQGVSSMTCEVQELPPPQSREYDPEGLYAKWLLSLCGRPLYRMVFIAHKVPQRFDICFTFEEKPAR